MGLPSHINTHISTILRMLLLFGAIFQHEFEHPAWDGRYPKQIRFVLGTAGFLLSCPPLFDFGTKRHPLLEFPQTALEGQDSDEMD
jgi:hypothetical protein